MAGLNLWRLGTCFEAVKNFGLGALAYVPALLSGRQTVTLNLAGFGQVEVRVRDSDLMCFNQVFDDPYEPESSAHRDRLHAHYRALLAAKKTPVIIDAGANIGAASLWFATTFPEAIVMSVEPSPVSAQLLRTNTSARSNIRVVEAGLGGSVGQIALNTGEDSWADRTQRSVTGGIEIVTIGGLLEKAGHDASLFIVKIDVEGFEADVFSGDLGWIGAPSEPWDGGPAAIYIEPHDWMLPDGGSSRSFQAALCGKGLELLIRGENLIFVRQSASLLPAS
jgi:FkbM family methyltransferase